MSEQIDRIAERIANDDIDSLSVEDLRAISEAETGGEWIRNLLDAVGAILAEREIARLVAKHGRRKTRRRFGRAS